MNRMIQVQDKLLQLCFVSTQQLRLEQAMLRDKAMELELGSPVSFFLSFFNVHAHTRLYSRMLINVRP